MPPLTQMQIDRLNHLSAVKIVEYIDKGQVPYPFPIKDPEKKAEVERILSSRPNPAEQNEWAKLAQDYNIVSMDENMRRLTQYCDHWYTLMPVGNHIDEAKRLLAEIEEAEWQNVNIFSEPELLAYLKRYPRSVHKDEIDDTIWNMTKNDYNIKEAVSRYLMNFPMGRHSDEARRIIEAYDIWNGVNQYDIFQVKNYIDRYPDSPFRSEAVNSFNSLKKEEMDKMKSNPAGYNRNKLLSYVNNGIISEQELCHKGLMSNKALEKLRNFENIHLPNLNDSIMEKGCTEDNQHTDIFLFGIPSTGKTCVLMGLVRSTKLYYNSQVSGGRYADDLVQWVSAGMTPDHTPAVVTTIDAKIKNENGYNYINLVEMSGEEFATRLAINQNDDVSLEDMGEGTPELLSNNNKKAFYFIVDPTVETVTFTRTEEIYGEKHDENGNIMYDENGESVKEIIDYRDTTYSVDQELTLKKMVDLLFLPKHKSIMQKVKSINFIVTKADTLGDNREKQITNALEKVRQCYSHIIEAIVDNRQSMNYVFNHATDGWPKMYTFSLGRFYPGGIYEYDRHDADQLIDAFKGGTVIVKKKTFWDKFQDAVN